jgi:hypothetical protein
MQQIVAHLPITRTFPPKITNHAALDFSNTAPRCIGSANG